MKKSIISTIATLALVGFLAACGGGSGGSSVTIKSVASKNANAGYPVAFKIFALGSDHLFYGYDFYSLTLDPESVLGVTLRKVIDEVEVEPGQTAVFGPYDLPPNTRNIGVVGTFQSGERAKWRDTVKVNPNAMSQQIMVIVDKNAIYAVTPEEYNDSVKKAQDAAQAEADAKAADEAAKKKAADDAKKKAENAAKAKEAEKRAAEAERLRKEAEKLQAEADKLAGN